MFEWEMVENPLIPIPKAALFKGSQKSGPGAFREVFAKILFNLPGSEKLSWLLLTQNFSSAGILFASLTRRIKYFTRKESRKGGPSVFS
jgi:hypothetical protein